MTSKILITTAIVCFVSGCAVSGGSQLGAVMPGSETVLAEETQLVPARKIYGRSITLSVPATVKLDYNVESGKSVMYLLMTDEQYTRVVGGEDREPTVAGRDYIHKSDAVMGQGSDIALLPAPDRYIFVFWNESSEPVTVTSRVRGVRE